MSARPQTKSSTKSKASSRPANPPYPSAVLGRRGEGQGGARAVRVPPASDHKDSDASLLLRPTEVAATLGISRSKVFELLAAQELPSMRIGRSTRVPREQLEEWIKVQVAWQPRGPVGLLGRLQNRVKSECH